MKIKILSINIMVYFGYQQSKGGYAYYFSGKSGSAFRDTEKDTDTPDMAVDKDAIPEVEADPQNVEMAVEPRPTTEKVVMEVEVLEKGVAGTDGKDKESKIYN
tara:strand:+ start:3487 stop:3795 length:309 start_codon:yes stop_codon:yes gene_type:complete